MEGVIQMDKEARKKILRRIPYGLYILGFKNGDQYHAIVGSWVSQCSFEPPLLMLGIKKGSHAHALLDQKPFFSVNFPRKDQKKLVERFFKPFEVKDNKFGEVPFHLGKNEVPILDEMPGHFECKVREIIPGGDHDIVIAEILESELREDAETLTMKDTGWHYGG